MSENRAAIIQKAGESVKWSLATTFVPRLITPLSSAILASLLLPDDFGVVAISTLIVVLAQVLVYNGMPAAIIQRQDRVNEAASFAFFFSLTVSLLLYVALWAVSPLVEQGYGIDSVTEVIRVSSLSLIISALAAIPRAMLRRQMAFKRLFWVSGFPLIVSSLSSVVWALLGGGVWALVLGPLMGNAFGAILAWRLSDWRPTLSMLVDWPLIRSLWGFSFWVMLAGFQLWLFSYSDNAIAGFFFDARELGYYSVGFNFSVLLPALVNATLVDVAYPAFCALPEPADVGNSLLKIQKISAPIVFPLSFGLSVMAVPGVALVFGSEWKPMGQVMAFFAIMPGLTHFWSLNKEAYKAIGKPGMGTKISALTLVLMWPLLLLTGPKGLMTYVVTRSAVALLEPVLHIFWGKRVLFTSAREQVLLLAQPLAASLIMYGVLFLLTRVFKQFNGLAGLGQIVFMVISGSLIYLTTLWLINRELVLQTLTALQRIGFRFNLQTLRTLANHR